MNFNVKIKNMILIYCFITAILFLTNHTNIYAYTFEESSYLEKYTNQDITRLSLTKSETSAYNINTDLNDGGNIDVTTTSVAGEEVIFNVNVNDVYKLEEKSLKIYTITGKEVLIENKDLNYSFIMPDESIVIVARFTPNNSTLNYMDLNYIESLAHINNPERGFYRTGYAWITNEKADHTGYSSGPLVHLRVSLSSFNINNGSGDIPAHSVESFARILEGYRQRDVNIILRFNYDQAGYHGNTEPDIEKVLDHIEQLSPLFFEYDDVISTIDTGLLGPWGEQHTSTIVTQENINKMIDQFLKYTPDDMVISVRRPSYFAKWVGVEYNDLNSYVASKASDAYRVGIYNDGYLGSHSDLGTFLYHPTLGWRENENLFFENHNTHTFYGGEVVTDGIDDNFAYNSSYYMTEEMFRTHTTYLNFEWNQSVINSWKTEEYTGDDYMYETQTGHTYISNHLGYRYVLKSSYLSDVYLNYENTLYLKGEILNVGAASLINSKKVEIVLSNGADVYSYTTDLDFRDILSKESMMYDFKIKLNDDLKLGEYNVYLRVSSDDENSELNSSIKFANYDIYDSDVVGNYIGKITVLNKEYYDISSLIDSKFTDIEFSNSNAAEGEKISFKINSNDKYKVKEGTLRILSGDTLIEYTYQNGSYIFTMPATDVYITAEFQEINNSDEEVYLPQENDDTDLTEENLQLESSEEESSNSENDNLDEDNNSESNSEEESTLDDTTDDENNNLSKDNNDEDIQNENIANNADSTIDIEYIIIISIIVIVIVIIIIIYTIFKNR